MMNVRTEITNEALAIKRQMSRIPGMLSTARSKAEIRDLIRRYDVLDAKRERAAQELDQLDGVGQDELFTVRVGKPVFGGRP